MELISREEVMEILKIGMGIGDYEFTEIKEKIISLPSISYPNKIKELIEKRMSKIEELGDGIDSYDLGKYNAFQELLQEINSL